ncbi:MAG: rhodanese-like domain-containing protein [Clostridium sp.]|uniref:rhodanese-like domain-containing protein n=1 Tax=Clostridium sp. TaxID=1506 RepID=UPI002910D63E|nr:rhodanese-like domain-containing protein [Clostridium sp.]MDU5111357.1 rhodanese-like domain-containing protein [Clostridium sp.]
MRKNIIVLFLILSTLVISGCTTLNKETSSKGQESAMVSKITAEEAKEEMNNSDVIILDVRTEEEYNSGHIKKSVLIPVDDLENKAEEVLVNKEQKILVYCRSGNRSKKAADLLVEIGYTNVYDFGGIKDWPYEIVK